MRTKKGCYKLCAMAAGVGCRDEALTRLTEEDGVGHGNAIASLIETRMVLRAATQCFITCET